jgi:hypothetical protein
MILNSKNLTILKSLLVFFLSVFIVYTYVNILQYRLINPDGGYYLWIVNKVWEGKIPGIDIKTGYTPLSFYLLSIVRAFTDSPTYFHYLYILLTIQLLNASLLYFISKHYTTNKFIPALASLMYLLMSFHSDGSLFILEPFVNLFGLLSLLFYLSFRNYNSYYMLVPGILGALSFFCKQYGLVYSLAVPFLLMIDNKNVSSAFKRIFLYSIGYAIPFIAFILYYRIEGCRLREIITIYSGSGYGQRSIGAYFSGLYTLIKIYGIFLPFSFWVLIKKGIRNHILIYLYLIFGFSLQFFFYKFPHYYILLIPYLILSAAIIYESLKERQKLLLTFFFLLIFTLIINIYANILTLKIFSGSNGIIKENYTEQIKNSIQIRNYVGENDKVLLFNFDLTSYYFLCNLSPPLEKKYGIIFFGLVSPDKYLENIIHTDYVLIRNESLPGFYTELKSISIKWTEIRISNDLILLKKDI